MHEVVEALRAGLASVADPAKAPAMRRYMKSELPFRGVPAPQRRRMARAVLAAYPIDDPDTWEEAVRALWFAARFREERYVALDLMDHRLYRRWQTPERLGLFAELVTSGAWWDLVDEIATHRIGPLLRAHRDAVGPVMRRWAASDDLWQRRAAILCQVGARTATDTALLAACVEAAQDDKDFFLRKAIGWALRDYSRTDPDWVRAFVEAHPGLSPLARKEALRYVRAGQATS